MSKGLPLWQKSNLKGSYRGWIPPWGNWLMPHQLLLYPLPSYLALPTSSHRTLPPPVNSWRG
jgi:hypothetical protein